MSRVSATIERRSADAILTLPVSPVLSLAPRVFDWCHEYIRQPDGPDAGEPWRFTREQQRFLWYLYAVDKRGRFLWTRAVLRRPKGWGKSPMMAALGLAELCGPTRFAGVDDAGEPEGVPASLPWVQIAGVSEKQTTNTMSMVLAMIGESPIIDKYHLDPGLTRVFAGNGGRLEPITASAPTAEGARPTFCVLDETHHWTRANGGHKLAEVIRRNLGKSRDGMARSVETTNAHQIGGESVAERSHDAWLAQSTGQSRGSTILYDSREAPTVDLADDEALAAALRAAYGDSSWIDLERISGEVYDPATPPSESRRFYLNQLATGEDAWLDPPEFDACGDLERGVGTSMVWTQNPGGWVLFLDASKSDDATALVGVRVDDGHVLTLGVWQRPVGLERDVRWTVPRDEVDSRVELVFSRFDVLGFFADPSHTKDDATSQRYWDGLIDDWHTRFQDRLVIWADGKRHSVMWDMTSSARTQQFTEAAERCYRDIRDGDLTHDADPRLVQHVRNARRAPNQWGVSIAKEHRESARKIDLATAMVGARMLRRLVLNQPRKPVHTGIVYVD